jgi:hypothetical protein
MREERVPARGPMTIQPGRKRRGLSSIAGKRRKGAGSVTSHQPTEQANSSASVTRGAGCNFNRDADAHYGTVKRNRSTVGRGCQEGNQNRAPMGITEVGRSRVPGLPKSSRNVQRKSLVWRDKCCRVPIYIQQQASSAGGSRRSKADPFSKTGAAKKREEAMIPERHPLRQLFHEVVAGCYHRHSGIDNPELTS